MNISKKTREDAALICELAWYGEFTDDVAGSIGASGAAIDMVFDAWRAVQSFDETISAGSDGEDRRPRAGHRRRQLPTRDGWNPGDPVEVRK